MFWVRISGGVVKTSSLPGSVVEAPFHKHLWVRVLGSEAFSFLAQWLLGQNIG